MNSRQTLRVLTVLAVLLVSACSLPRIIVLKDPLTPEEHVNLGVAYERRGELDEAFAEYRKASAEIPLALLYMGNVHFHKGEYRVAEARYREALAARPDLADAYNNLAWLYCTLGIRLDEAEALVRRALELKPAHDTYLDTLGRIRELRRVQGS